MQYAGIAHLSPSEQQDALEKGASFVMKSKFRDCDIALYKTEDVLVEVWMGHDNGIKDIKALNRERLTPLLKHFAAGCLN